MEQRASSIQVLLQAAEYLDRRERASSSDQSAWVQREAEHGYASLYPTHSLGPVNRGRRRPKAPRDSLRSVHSELEKHRRAQLRRCLEQLKQQMPLNTDCARYTTLSLLRRARLHIQLHGEYGTGTRKSPYIQGAFKLLGGSRAARPTQKKKRVLQNPPGGRRSGCSGKRVS
ncbi:max dimerization protein 3 isoform X3 [Petaurus breviceps papuanus]|uniref:max dimerization protein 3 isoform X3 n=1 Tax=Petaurus breviceps papuanus TaxID=3040969 RepID=UPI0036DEBB71